MLPKWDFRPNSDHSTLIYISAGMCFSSNAAPEKYKTVWKKLYVFIPIAIADASHPGGLYSSKQKEKK
jgi:hypothetical protein